MQRSQRNPNFQLCDVLNREVAEAVEMEHLRKLYYDAGIQMELLIALSIASFLLVAYNGILYCQARSKRFLARPAPTYAKDLRVQSAWVPTNRWSQLGVIRQTGSLLKTVHLKLVRWSQSLNLTEGGCIACVNRILDLSFLLSYYLEWINEARSGMVD
jgi:hypothetical protein